MHKRIRLTPYDHEEICCPYQKWKTTLLAEHFRVGRPTIYKVLKQAQLQHFKPSNSSKRQKKLLNTA